LYDDFGERLFEIRLFHVEVDQMQLSFKGEKKIGCRSLQIHVDSADPHKFLICYQTRNNKTFGRQGQITSKGRLQIEGANLDMDIQIPGKFFYNCSHRFSGNYFLKFHNHIS
jgi:hypothetical protein